MEMRQPSETKKALLKRSAQYRSELEDEVNLLSERTQKIVTNAVVIGGALVISYLLVRQFTKPAKAKNKSGVKKIKLVNAEPREDAEYAPEQESRMARIASDIGNTLVNQATAFLLALAREKLVEYLQTKAEKRSKNDERP